uniref:Laminin G domain-containing protein n=1 Tax=Anopheles minimus TaxID=112268 RepID=A0A182VRV5_9DIPT
MFHPSNGSVQYTHRDGPVQGRPAVDSFMPTGATPVDTAYPDGTGADASSSPGPLNRRNAEPISEESPIKPDCLNRRLRRQLVESTPSTVTEDLPGDSSLESTERNVNDFHPMIVTDNSIDSTAHNLDTDHTSPLQAHDHKRKSSTADERVNLQQPGTSNKHTRQTDETPDERAVPKSMEKDLKAEGQISRTLSEILPVTLIVFGRLSVGGNDGGGSGDAATDKLLRVDPYVGLLRWDDQLEGALWQALGWSEWSYYTSCSVACGGGVQQRFRHCLKSAPEDGVATEARSTTSVPPTVTPATERHEIEKPTAARTQPVSYDAPPGVSIDRASLGSEADGKRKRKLKSKQTAVDERRRRMKFLEKVNEKSIMNPSTSEPISSEAGSPWTPTVQGKSVPLHERLLVEPAVKTHHNRQADGADDGEGTWPVCEGHNIEQRKCNLFECAGTINLLTSLTPNYHWRTWDEVIDDRINYQINQLDQNFTLMMSLRLKPPAGSNSHPGQQTDDDNASDPSSTVRPISGHIFSVRSKLTTGSSLSINFETDGHGGIRVLQEKYGLSEMLPVRSGKHTLSDGDWHSLALSGRNGGFVTVYIDCQWINSFVLTKGSIELPQYPIVEIGQNVELRQLTVVPGEKSARLQCNSQPVPIHDVENRRVTNYFEHLN